MSKLFMYGTSFEGIEQLMVMVPNFQPRRSGIGINLILIAGDVIKIVGWV